MNLFRHIDYSFRLFCNDCKNFVVLDNFVLFSADTRLEHVSIDERTDYFQQSLGVLKTNWPIGTGIGNYTAYLAAQDEMMNRQKVAFQYQPVHSIYPLVFAELGLFGIIAFLGMLIALWLGTPTHTTAQITLKAAFAGLLIIGLFDHYLWSLHVGILLFWLTIGLLEHSRHHRA